jgi:hypothetical protein
VLLTVITLLNYGRTWATCSPSSPRSAWRRAC